LLTRNCAELINLINAILVWNEARTTTRLAILANIDWGTNNAVIETSCLVNRAGLISDIVFVHELKSTQGFTTVATVVLIRARNNDLR